MPETSEFDVTDPESPGSRSGEPANRTGERHAGVLQQKSEDRMTRSIGSRIQIASFLAAACLLFRPTASAADPNQCQEDCFRAMVEFAWDCTGGPGAIVCVVVPNVCLHCAAKGTAAYNLCLEGCSEEGGPSAPYQVLPNESVIQYRLGDEVPVQVGRSMDGEFLPGPGNVTGAVFRLLDLSGIPEGGFPPDLPIDAWPWIPAGFGEFDGDRFWRIELNMAEHVSQGAPVSGFLLRVDLEDSVYSTQMGMSVLMLQECACPAEWTEHPGSVPSARNAHAAAYDEASETLTLFGGNDGVSGLGDTWGWDGSQWTQLAPLNSPSPRWGHMMVWDRETDRIILHGGFNAELGYLNDTWMWDGVTWTFVSNAGPTCGFAGMAYAADRSATVLYGGATASGRSRDTWEFDGIASWTLVTDNSPPGFRSFHTMVYDEAAERIHMFGGQLPGGVETNDNWVYDDGSWTNLGPSGPSPRISHQMGVRSSCGTILLHGGEKDGVLYDDLWEYVGEWRQLSSGGGAAGPLRLATLTRAPRDRTVLFGGSSGAQVSDEMWTFGCELDPSDAPNAPSRADRLHLAVHPNPFQPRTTLVYDLPEAGRVSLTVYDVRGRRVATIADAHQSAGRHSVEWNGADRNGRALPSGVYMIRMEAGGNAAIVHVGVIR